MFNSKRAPILVALPLIAAAAMAAMPAPSRNLSPRRACDVIFADTIPAGQRMVASVARLSEEAGDSVWASFPAEANLIVSEAKRGNVPKTIDLTVNAASAMPGDWKLTIRSSKGVCAGVVTVAKRPAKPTSVPISRQRTMWLADE